MKRSHHGDVDRFDRWSATYDRPLGQRLLFGPVHRQLCRALLEGRAPATIVDVGCGTGLLLEAIRRVLPEAELVGIDPSQGMTAVARSRFAGVPRVRIEMAPAQHMPLDGATADVVTTTLSFHHWDDQGASLCEVARVLRPGGRLLLADILGAGVMGRLVRPFGRRHGRGYGDAAGLSALLSAAGFASWRRRRLFWPGVPLYLVEARLGRIDG
jgi:ubiquinone/menaquinone biosynthesis C-methylase UbiE